MNGPVRRCGTWALNVNHAPPRATARNSQETVGTSLAKRKAPSRASPACGTAARTPPAQAVARGTRCRPHRSVSRARREREKGIGIDPYLLSSAAAEQGSLRVEEEAARSDERGARALDLA